MVETGDIEKNDRTVRSFMQKMNNYDKNVEPVAENTPLLYIYLFHSVMDVHIFLYSFFRERHSWSIQ